MTETIFDIILDKVIPMFAVMDVVFPTCLCACVEIAHIAEVVLLGFFTVEAEFPYVAELVLLIPLAIE